MSGAGGLGLAGLQVMPACAKCELYTAGAVSLASGNVVLAAAAMLSWTACACVPGGRGCAGWCRPACLLPYRREVERFRDATGKDVGALEAEKAARNQLESRSKAQVQLMCGAGCLRTVGARGLAGACFIERGLPCRSEGRLGSLLLLHVGHKQPVHCSIHLAG